MKIVQLVLFYTLLVLSIPCSAEEEGAGEGVIEGDIGV